ncbi:STAS domain-containing protein [Streptomyces sp. NPDC059928]|uniref:STAS domain-containing protein n=1 Tax=unclassified Streptomyces TaxID=2593676 RepID=UPI0036659FCA
MTTSRGFVYRLLFTIPLELRRVRYRVRGATSRHLTHRETGRHDVGADELAFRLRTRSVEGTIIIELHGELDMLAHLELGPRVHALTRLATRGVVVDLRAVTFLDAGGIRLLLTVRQEMVRRGGELRLIRGMPQISKVLRIVRLDEVFTVLDGLPTALADGATTATQEPPPGTPVPLC